VEHLPIKTTGDIMGNLTTRRGFIGALPAVLAPLPAVLPNPLFAQESEFPNRVVKVICPFGAGGLSDVLTRRIANYLGERLGQKFIVENRVGASGAIGLSAVVGAPPDGYTLGYGSFSTLVLNPILNPAFPFRPETALTPTCFLGEQAFALAVSPSMGVSTLPELVAKLKANPNKYNFGSPGTGLTQHVLGELFKKSAGVDMTHVPFQSDAQSFQAVVSDTVQMAFTNFALYRGLLDRVRLLAIAAPTRSAQLASVPTFDEQGVSGVNLTVWHGLFATANTPRPIIDKIDREIQTAFSTAEMRTYYELNGLIPVGQPVESFRKRYLEEIRQWKQIVPQLGLKMT
jgi:tripartite-type tricarboxylate transporter receptor subunit TctC